MSVFGKVGTVRSRSRGRAVMLIGVLAAALIWSGLFPPLSGWVWKTDAVLCDQLSLLLPAPEEREDLVFIGIDEDTRKQSDLDPVVLGGSRALTLMQQKVGNDRLDRRIYAELIERLASAGARMIIFDVLFVGPSGIPEADREFAEAIQRHHDKIVLSMFLNNAGGGNYQPVSSVEQLPLLTRSPDRLPHEGYVNLWPDAEDNLVRRVDYTLTLGELKADERQSGERVYESLSAMAGRLLGVTLPKERAPRLRYAMSGGMEHNFTSAYAPHSLRGIFVPEQWRDKYGNGEFFRDKVVLISTSTLRDEDYHAIPGGVIYGGQFHLQALGSLLDRNYWQSAPQWVNICALLGMAIMATGIGMALRHPFAIFVAALAVGGGFLVFCAWVSNFTGVLFAGTPGLLGLAIGTIAAELGHIVARDGARKDAPA